MLQAALVCFGIAALGGLAMVGIRASKGENPPTGLALLHGGLAAAGVVLLIVLATQGSLPSPGGAALGIFVLAALGGAYLFLGHHLRGKLIPLGVVGVHAVAAVIAFVVLIVSATS